MNTDALEAALNRGRVDASLRAEIAALKAEVRRLQRTIKEQQHARLQRDAMTSRLARILRLTYQDEMPDAMADLIRPLCAAPFVTRSGGEG